MGVYKKDEGMWARVPIALIGGAITVATTRAAMDWVSGSASYIAGGIAFLIMATITLFFAFFHQKTGEVLIDTEGEMRKVVWPNRDEVTGSTIVVIVTTVLLGVGIYALDRCIGGFLILVNLY
jgi:preprotein translocase SecE subunit